MSALTHYNTQPINSLHYSALTHYTTQVTHYTTQISKIRKRLNVFFRASCRLGQTASPPPPPPKTTAAASTTLKNAGKWKISSLYYLSPLIIIFFHYFFATFPFNTKTIDWYLSIILNFIVFFNFCEIIYRLYLFWFCANSCSRFS